MDGGNEQRVAIKFCFKTGISATETLVLVQKVHGNEALNRSNVFMWYSRFWDGRELIEDDERCGRPKSTWIDINIAAVTDLVRKWPSNRIKNDSRIFEHSQGCSSLDSERGFGKEKVVCTFCSTLLEPWSKGRSRHILPKHYRDDRCRQNFFRQNYYGRWDLVFCLWPRNKAKEFWIGWWDIASAEETKIRKVPHQDHVDKIFSTLKA